MREDIVGVVYPAQKRKAGDTARAQQLYAVAIVRPAAKSGCGFKQAGGGRPPG